MEIHLVIVDDWELRGDGSGDMRRIQFEQMHQIRDIYEQHEIRGTFNAEVMQQITHLAWADREPHLGELAAQWADVVKDTYAAGHDVQLHVHPQWSDAIYSDGKWDLRGSWSLVDYSESELERLLWGSKRYLEGLIREVDNKYQCLSFRGGAWCIAPSRHIVTVLSEMGIVFDMSIVDGLHYDLDFLKLDYRDIDEPFLPYYPDITDARRLSHKKQPVVCCPTYSFDFTIGKSRLLFGMAASRLAPRLFQFLFTPPNATPVMSEVEKNAYSAVWQPVQNTSTIDTEAHPKKGKIRSFLEYLGTGDTPEHYVADLSMLTPLMVQDMLKSIRTKARKSKISPIPVILENHTKDIGNFKPIEYFAKLVSKQSDFRVLTAREVAENIKNGVYSVRSA